MKKTLWLIPTLALLFVGAGCSSQTGSGTPPSSAPVSAAPASPSSAASAHLKFADQPYASYAYLISTDPLSADAQAALAGFQLTKTAMADGSAQYLLKAVKAGYHDQEYVIKPGEKLYFLEKYMQDDEPESNGEFNMHDDQAVVVDSNGYVLQGPLDFVQQ